MEEVVRYGRPEGYFSSYTWLSAIIASTSAQISRVYFLQWYSNLNSCKIVVILCSIRLEVQFSWVSPLVVTLWFGIYVFTNCKYVHSRLASNPEHYSFALRKINISFMIWRPNWFHSSFCPDRLTWTLLNVYCNSSFRIH